MRNYQTAEEKAHEWNITANHVQYLCRKGKVEGAEKRAGAWFIPEDAPIPVKNTKSNTKGFKFIGTKNRIFNSAIKMFMSKGFTDVSLKDIADDVGVRQSTIYNHFSSKQEILNTIYEFYRHHYLIDRPSMEEMEQALRTDSLENIIDHISYKFKEDYIQKISDITKIIFQRVAIDDQAREIAKTLMIESGIKFVEDVFNKGIEIGRLAPFDTHSMSVFINSIRIFTFYNWIVDPSAENMTKVTEGEYTLYKHAANHLTDLKFAT